MPKKMQNYIKNKISGLADYDIGCWAESIDPDLGEAIYEYDDKALDLHIVLYELAFIYQYSGIDFIVDYKDITLVDNLLTLPEVARINGGQQLNELVSFQVITSEITRLIKVPFKVYVYLAPLMVGLSEIGKE